MEGFGFNSQLTAVRSIGSHNDHGVIRVAMSMFSMMVIFVRGAFDFAMRTLCMSFFMVVMMVFIFCVKMKFFRMMIGFMMEKIVMCRIRMIDRNMDRHGEALYKDESGNHRDMESF